MSNIPEDVSNTQFRDLDLALMDLGMLSAEIQRVAQAMPLDFLNVKKLAATANDYAWALSTEITDAANAAQLLRLGVPLAETFSNGSKAPAVPTPRQVLYLAARARRELINGVPEVRDPFED